MKNDTLYLFVCLFMREAHLELGSGVCLLSDSVKNTSFAAGPRKALDWTESVRAGRTWRVLDCRKELRHSSLESTEDLGRLLLTSGGDRTTDGSTEIHCLLGKVSVSFPAPGTEDETQGLCYARQALCSSPWISLCRPVTLGILFRKT